MFTFELITADVGILDISALTTRTAFNAVSYTWGDPAALTEVTIDGALITVRRNAYKALRQHAMHHAEDYLWMDSICMAGQLDISSGETNQR